MSSAQTEPPRGDESSVAALNAAVYDQEQPYDESPHLRHRSIHDALLARLHQAVLDVSARGLPLTLLDVGAGAGPFVEPALAYGCRVVATDVAAPPLDALTARYACNPRFAAVLDSDGDLSALGQETYSIALYASVLHHIPDYMGALESTLARLTPGGALLTFQDPLWYPSLPPHERWAAEAMYVAWRVTQRRDYVTGVRSRVRRARGRIDPASPSDMVEYHVVRQGVDHQRIEQTLGSRFTHFEVVKYWSTPSRVGQRLGERFGLTSDFATVGLGYR